MTATTPLRIVAAADSLALPRPAPDNISWEQVWPTLLEERLCRAGLDSRVLNHGQRARTLPDLLATYEDVVACWNPGLVVLQIGIVDCAPRLFSRREHKFLNEVIYWRLAKPLIRLASRNRRAIITLRPWVRYTPHHRFRKALGQLGRRVQGIADRVFVLPILPSFESHVRRSPGYNESVARYNQSWKEWCEACRCRFIPVEELLAGRDVRDLLLDDGHHLSVQGHAQCAEILGGLITAGMD
jgi:lysophospholipase L1-like esterase